jgi:hypothetical protein
VIRLRGLQGLHRSTIRSAPSQSIRNHQRSCTDIARHSVPLLDGRFGNASMPSLALCRWFDWVRLGGPTRFSAFVNR